MWWQGWDQASTPGLSPFPFLSLNGSLMRPWCLSVTSFLTKAPGVWQIQRHVTLTLGHLNFLCVKREGTIHGLNILPWYSISNSSQKQITAQQNQDTNQTTSSKTKSNPPFKKGNPKHHSHHSPQGKPTLCLPENERNVLFREHATHESCSLPRLHLHENRHFICFRFAFSAAQKSLSFADFTSSGCSGGWWGQWAGPTG